MKKNLFLVLIVFFSVPSFSQNLDDLVDNAVKISLQHLENSVTEVGDSSRYPDYGTKDLKWGFRKSRKWTSAFYPGCLWYAYELSGDERFEKWAARWTEPMENEINNTRNHDLGFMFGCTFGNGLQLGTTKDYSGYKDIMLSASETLAGRYHEKIGCLRSNWDGKYFENTMPVVTDIMMNLELLLWASENGGKKEWADYAINHALNTYKDFVRPDASTYHIVRYDSTTAEIINKGTLQGEGDETTWSRGHAWTAYGMVVLYRYTKDEKFLTYAKELMDYFIEHLEDDYTALWDFDTKIKYIDASASAIVCSALFEMVNYVEDDELRKHYTENAENMLATLCQKPYLIEDMSVSPILDHSVQYYTRQMSIDVPAIFADYYFLEAIVRYKGLRKF